MSKRGTGGIGRWTQVIRTAAPNAWHGDQGSEVKTVQHLPRMADPWRMDRLSIGPHGHPETRHCFPKWAWREQYLPDVFVGEGNRDHARSGLPAAVPVMVWPAAPSLTCTPASFGKTRIDRLAAERLVSFLCYRAWIEPRPVRTAKRSDKEAGDGRPSAEGANEEGRGVNERGAGWRHGGTRDVVFSSSGATPCPWKVELRAVFWPNATNEPDIIERMNNLAKYVASTTLKRP